LVSEFSLVYPIADYVLQKELYLSRNDYNLKDNYWNFFDDGDMNYFFGEGRKTTKIQNIDVSSVIYDSIVYQHEREVLNIFEVAGQIGGVFQLFHI